MQLFLLLELFSLHTSTGNKKREIRGIIELIAKILESMPSSFKRYELHLYEFSSTPCRKKCVSINTSLSFGNLCSVMYMLISNFRTRLNSK